MKKLVLFVIAFWTVGQVSGQRVLTLDSCRALALRNNKKLVVSRNSRQAASYEHKAAKTNYLPRVGLDGGYVWNMRSTHLLSDATRGKLSSLGTTAGGGLAQMAQGLAQESPALAPLLSSLGTALVPTLNSVGMEVVDAFKTSTYNIYSGALVLTQPIYLGGRLKAYDRITNYTEKLLGAQYDHLTEEVIYSVDQAYWQVISLAGKRRLAESYVKMLHQLDDNIKKMYREGVVTKANVLTVDVKLNEAEMTMTKVDDGLSLAKMLLCQTCGLPVNESVNLADEEKMEIPVQLQLSSSVDLSQALSHRKDLQALEEITRIADENVKIVRGNYLPTLAGFGAYVVTNPNVYNGFKNKFGGNLSVGLTLHVPIWSWGEGKYRIRAARLLADNQRQLYQDAKELIDLQVNQARFKVNEAQKKLVMARKNQEKADENLHYADVGFREGVIAVADMLEAQTAWLQASSEKLDAEIDVKLSDIYLNKALGSSIYK